MCAWAAKNKIPVLAIVSYFTTFSCCNVSALWPLSCLHRLAVQTLHRSFSLTFNLPAGTASTHTWWFISQKRFHCFLDWIELMPTPRNLCKNYFQKWFIDESFRHRRPTFPYRYLYHIIKYPLIRTGTIRYKVLILKECHKTAKENSERCIRRQTTLFISILPYTRNVRRYQSI